MIFCIKKTNSGVTLPLCDKNLWQQKIKKKLMASDHFQSLNCRKFYDSNGMQQVASYPLDTAS